MRCQSESEVRPWRTVTATPSSFHLGAQAQAVRLQSDMERFLSLEAYRVLQHGQPRSRSALSEPEAKTRASEPQARRSLSPSESSHWQCSAAGPPAASASVRVFQSAHHTGNQRLGEPGGADFSCASALAERRSLRPRYGRLT
eukprot:3062065-Rhodomonas_salina.1